MTSDPTIARHTRSVSDEPSALELVGVSAGYGRMTVLRDVSIDVPAAGITALLGANGAGKTTLLKTISGFIKPATGTVHLFGEDITALQPYRRFEAGMCHVPEGRGVFRSLTVRENLMMQSRKGHEAEAMVRVCEMFPVLGSRLHQAAGTLSGGEQQMLAMATAYVRSPRLILVDEASLGLAPLIVDKVFDFITAIAKDGSALLIVDQFVDRALGMADRVYVLTRGLISFAGTPQDLARSELASHYLGI